MDQPHEIPLPDIEKTIDDTEHRQEATDGDNILHHPTNNIEDTNGTTPSPRPSPSSLISNRHPTTAPPKEQESKVDAGKQQTGAKTKKQAVKIWCKRRKLGKSQTTLMASPEQNINRHPMDHYNAQTPTQTKPEENSNTNRLKTNDPPQEKTKKEAKQKENETDNAKDIREEIGRIITKNTHHESNDEQSETDTEQTPLIETTNEEHLPTKESNEVNNEDLDQNSNLATQQKSI